MFTFETKKEVKSLVSGLRRELRLKNIEVQSYNQLLDAVAKAMGLSGAEELNAKLPDVKEAPPGAAPEASRYPLSNRGQFDFCKTGSLVIGRDFTGVTGRSESIAACNAYVNGGTRKAAGGIDPEFGDETDVNWNCQAPELDERGIRQYFTEDYGCVAEDLLVVIPDLEDCDHVHEWTADPESVVLPRRRALIAEYLRWFREVERLNAPLEYFNNVYDECTWAAPKIGFALTAREVKQFIKEFQAPAVAK